MQEVLDLEEVKILSMSAVFYFWLSVEFCSLVLMFFTCSAGSGVGLDTEGGWAMPDILVTIRKLGEEPQPAVIREVMMVSVTVLTNFVTVVT